MDERPYILWFNECTIESIPSVGGKNASLGELLKAGMPVPPGFAITTEAYREFLKQENNGEKIKTILSDFNPDERGSSDDISKNIGSLIESTPIPEEIEQAIRTAYDRLSDELGEKALAVAVRSSATAEDLPGASFAGQQDTFLWVSGADNIMEKVKRCWSSLFTTRAIHYRTKMGFPHEKVFISVGIQKMVEAEAAGVMFTLNPMNGDPSIIAIDANWGLGESVVQGEVTPDSYIVDKVTLEIIKRNISSKSICYTLDDRREQVECVEVPPEKRETPCVNDESLGRLAKIGKLIEQYYEKPQDIEWAVDCKRSFPENIFILQSRPETVWSQKKPEPIIKGKKSAMELILDRLSGGSGGA